MLDRTPTHHNLVPLASYLVSKSDRFKMILLYVRGMQYPDVMCNMNLMLVPVQIYPVICVMFDVHLSRISQRLISPFYAEQIIV